jgi:putative radical SAM enzyme (TIGR03279 family)
MREGAVGEGSRTGVGVEAVAPGSPADRAGIVPGDRILSVSGRPVEDLLDLHFLTSRSRFTLAWRDASGTGRKKEFRPGGEPPGIFPEPIRVRRCRNRCIFCFVHQLPKGLRRTLYVKDEDVRLSFLHGQYVTFSDLSDAEASKIVRYRLSPLYVSIHTTDPALRRRMLGNPGAADVMRVMRRLIGDGIVLHGQIVVCPGVNDGAELARTLRQLSGLRPGLRTVAVVPVGLTSHRAGLPPLRPVTRDEARETLDLLRALGKELGGGADGEPFAVAADEYYLTAGRDVPGRRSYGSFAQIENGVGLVRRFRDEASSLFRRKRWPGGAAGGTVATGRSASRLISGFLEEFSSRAGAGFVPVPVRNRLMGESVTVTGLLGGNDIATAVGGKVRGTLYIPSVTLRDAGDLFLDGLSPLEVARRTGAPVVLFEPTPRGFHDAVYSRNRPEYH